MNDIVHRTVEKDEKLATLRDHREHVNACKSLERKLDLDLKREKVLAVVSTSTLLMSDNNDASTHCIAHSLMVSETCPRHKSVKLRFRVVFDCCYFKSLCPSAGVDVPADIRPATLQMVSMSVHLQ